MATKTFLAAAGVMLALSCGKLSNVFSIRDIGPEGGTISTENNEAMLEVPEGALDRTVTIEIVEAAGVPPGNVGKAFDFKPDGLKFLKPVTITIAYKPGDVPSGFSEVFLRLGTVAGGKWEALVVSSVDTAAKRVTGETDHFTPYGVVNTQECRSDADCVPGMMLCVNGKCAECTKDEDCGAGKVCRLNVCEALPRNPCENMGGMCVSGVCPKGKHAEGYECTPAGTICCLPGCKADSDCPSGEECQNGSCVAVAECTHRCDCNQGWECVDGTCIVMDSGDIGVVYCCENTGCPDGAPCEFRSGKYDTCQGSPDGGTDAGDAGDGGTGECAADSDCAAGRICVDIGGLNSCEEGCRGGDGKCSRFFDKWDCSCGVVPKACGQAPEYQLHTCTEALNECCPGDLDGGTDAGDAGDGGGQGCKADSDCAAGQSCINGVCVSEPLDGGTDAGDGGTDGGLSFCEENGGACLNDPVDCDLGGNFNTDEFYQCPVGCCLGGVPCRTHDECGGAQTKLWCIEGSCLNADTPCEAAGGYCTIEAQCVGTYRWVKDLQYLHCAFGGECCLPRGCPDLMDCQPDMVCTEPAGSGGSCTPI
jgi:Cys-rich repeat protein